MTRSAPPSPSVGPNSTIRLGGMGHRTVLRNPPRAAREGSDCGQPRGVAGGQNRVRMPALMRYRLVLVPCLLAVLAAFGACGKEIGDACVIATDCDPNGVRICDPDPSSVDGYCTIQGCDVDTCPGEAVCVRFFSGSFSNKECNYSAGGVDGAGAPQCSLDELCALLSLIHI